VKQLLTGKVLSIDIGSRNMHLVQGRFHNNLVEIEKAVQYPTPEGTLKDGVIKDSELIQSQLRRLIKENHISADQVVVTVKSSNAISREVTIPTAKSDDLSDLIQIEMEQYVPNISTDYVTGYVLMNQVGNNGGTQMKYRVTAVPNTLVNSYMETLKQSGLKPKVMDVHSNTLAKLVRLSLSAQKPESSAWHWQTAAFIDLGYELTEINIMTNDKLVFTRLIPVGSRLVVAELTTHLMLAIDQVEKKIFDETNLTVTQFSKPDTEMINGIVRSHTQRWMNDIQNTLQFFSGRTTENKIDTIYLYGGFSGLKGLPELFSSRFNIPVQCLSELPVLSNLGVIKPAEISQYINAIGALVRFE
jgi:type IV pilus assembly protein PilM